MLFKLLTLKTKPSSQRNSQLLTSEENMCDLLSY